jgi:hypothetical protein
MPSEKASLIESKAKRYRFCRKDNLNNEKSLFAISRKREFIIKTNMIEITKLNKYSFALDDRLKLYFKNSEYFEKTVLQQDSVFCIINEVSSITLASIRW